MQAGPVSRDSNAIQTAAQAGLRTFPPGLPPDLRRWRGPLQAVVPLAVCGITAPRALAQSIPFSGFDNSPLGNATLALTPDGLLAVANIGSSGQDGVEIALPASNSVTIMPGDIDGDGTPDLAVGGALDLDAVGLRESPTKQSLVRTHIARTAVDQIVCDADFSQLGSTALMAGFITMGNWWRKCGWRRNPRARRTGRRHDHRLQVRL